MAANRIWCDLETTGLDPRGTSERPPYMLELALVATTADAEYRELAHQSWVIGWGLTDADWRRVLDPAVYEMHTRNGLLLEVPFGTPLGVAEDEAIKFVQHFGNPAPGREPIAGSSVHFDRGWLALHAPRLLRQFSHRCFDASTLTKFAQDLGAALPRAEAAHRALADVRASIQLARDVARAVRRG